MLPWPLKYSENQRSLFERKAVILSKIFVMCSHEESHLRLRCDSSWGLRIFSLSHAHDKIKTSFSKFSLLLKLYLTAPKNASHLISPHKDHKNKRNAHRSKRLLIDKQILLVCTIGNI